MAKRQVFPVKVFGCGENQIDCSGTLVFEPGVNIDEYGELSTSMWLDNNATIQAENSSSLVIRTWNLSIRYQTHNNGNHSYKYLVDVTRLHDHETAKGRKERVKREKKQAELKRR